MKYVMSLLMHLLAVGLIAQNTFFVGTAASGGSKGQGTIFTTSNTGTNPVIRHDFSRIEGRSPWGNLCEATNGKLYGMTERGGTDDKGVLFEYDPSTGTYVVKFNFDGFLSTGSKPQGGLIQATNGKLYGLTYEGGYYGKGTLFEYDLTTNTFTKKLDLDGTNTGGSPNGDLLQASNGKLYAVMNFGGANNEGILLEYDLSNNTATKKVDFDNLVYGKYPRGSLMEASNGKLYGGCSQGGIHANGTLFEYDLGTNTCTRLYDFSGSDGRGFLGALLEVSTGKLYGTTHGGGIGVGGGVLFEYDFTNSTYTIKTYFNGTDGRNPSGYLLLASDGNVYGLCYNGGAHHQGTFWKYTLNNGSVVKILDYEGQEDGGAPLGGLLQASNGHLYGLILGYGSSLAGTLFEYNLTTESYSKKLDFHNSFEGMGLRASFIQASNDKLYGLADGGVYGKGILLEYDPIQHSHNKLLDFKDSLGFSPMGSLMQASNGKLYGTLSQGGVNSAGVLFEYDLTNMTYHIIYNFMTTEGERPEGKIVQGSNGKLYGTTVNGGINGVGVLFEYDPTTNVYAKKVDFDLATLGGLPNGELVESNGKLYGVTKRGGSSSKGVLFEYDPATNVYTKKIDFDGYYKGKYPVTGMVLAGDNNLYGVTLEGGTSNRGVLFQYDPMTDTYTKKIDFDGTNRGAKPSSSLLEASSGLLYGTTTEGGTNGDGTLFQYNFLTDTYTKKINFNSATTGKYITLMEVNTIPTGSTQLKNAPTASIYPNPTTGWVTIDLGKENEAAQVVIKSITGQQIQTFLKTNEQFITFELQGNAGTYLVEIITKEGTSTQHLIKG